MSEAEIQARREALSQDINALLESSGASEDAKNYALRSVAHLTLQAAADNQTLKVHEILIAIACVVRGWQGAADFFASVPEKLEELRKPSQ